MEKSLSDRAKLVDHLSKFIAAHGSVILTPELTRIALKELRSYASLHEPENKPAIAIQAVQ
jgi:hypothetical protein